MNKKAIVAVVLLLCTIIVLSGCETTTTATSMEDRILVENFGLTIGEVGEKVDFGTYSQGSSGSVRPIQWYVVEISDGKALLVSRYVLDYRPFNESGGTVTWEISSIRYWLNDMFFNTAFTSEEKNMIAPTTIDSEKGTTVTDNVFLLSTSEYLNYSSRNWSSCSPTEYAKMKGCGVSNCYFTASGANECMSWYLRSNSGQYDDIAVVLAGGIDLGYTQLGSNSGTRGGIRPAVWVYVNSGGDSAGDDESYNEGADDSEESNQKVDIANLRALKSLVVCYYMEKGNDIYNAFSEMEEENITFYLKEGGQSVIFEGDDLSDAIKLKARWDGCDYGGYISCTFDKEGKMVDSNPEL